MLKRIRAWWRDLAYCNGHPNDDGKVRTWGIRPWVGAPFLWFVVDRSETARPVGTYHGKPDSELSDVEAWAKWFDENEDGIASADEILAEREADRAEEADPFTPCGRLSGGTCPDCDEADRCAPEPAAPVIGTLVIDPTPLPFRGSFDLDTEPQPPPTHEEGWCDATGAKNAEVIRALDRTTKRRVWSIRPQVGGQWMLVDTLGELDMWLANESEPGAVFELRLEEMSEEDIEKLGEFDGW